MAYAAVLGVGIAIATFVAQYIVVSFVMIAFIMLFYITVTLLFIQWLNGEIK